MVRQLRGEALLDQRDRFVARVRPQRVVARGRQAGRFMRRVVPGEIGGGEQRRAARRGDRRAGVETARDDAARRPRRRAKTEAGHDRRQRTCRMPTVVTASQTATPTIAAHDARSRRCAAAGSRAARPVSQRCTQIAGHDRDQRAEHEGRVGRPAEQLHAGHQLVHHAEHRRVPAERDRTRSSSAAIVKKRISRDHSQPRAMPSDEQHRRRARRRRAGPCSARGTGRPCRSARSRRSRPRPRNRPSGPSRRTGRGTTSESRCVGVQRAAPGLDEAELRPVRVAARAVR